MKGIIALDVDGTITEEFHSVPEEVVDFLSALAASGWVIAFITGRPYAWGLPILKSFSFPYLLAVQNGAIILEMPSRQILKRKYLNKAILARMDEICVDEPTDYVIYAGFEYNDVCYYRPSRFSTRLLEYLKLRVQALGETYYPVVSYAQMPLENFPSIKCFGIPEDAGRIAKKMEAALGLHVTPVTDPYDGAIMVAQATHAGATKGQALVDIKGLYPADHIVIAAGNDYNDASMFSVSDIVVVMGNAPADLQELADVIAPTVGEKGIIPGLKQAIAAAVNRR